MEVLIEHGWEKVPHWDCLFVNREKGLFLSVCVDNIKLAGKKQNIDPMWKMLMKQVDLGEPTSYFDRENLGDTQRECETSKDIVDYPAQGNLKRTYLHGPTIWKVMQRNV